MAIRMWIVFASFALFTGCSSTPGAEDIQIQANCCDNRLDTKAGTYTKDLIADGDRTIPLQLTYAERAHILDAARTIDFFSLPHEIPLVPVLEIWEGDTVETFEISSSSCICSIRIESADETNFVKWGTDAGTPTQRRNLRWLLEEIWKIIESKPEYKALPRPSGVYL